MDTGEKPENEKRPSAQYRIILILVATTVVFALTLGTTLLAREVELRWSPLPVLQLVAAVIMTVVSGACINLLPTVATDIWKMKQPDRPKLSVRLRKGRVWRVAGVVVTVALLVLASLWWRPWRLEPGELVIMTAFPADPTDARTMLLEQWNRLNPNNRASFDFVAGSHDSQHKRMVKDAGGDQTADAYVLDIVWMAEFIARDYIQPLDETRLPNDQGDFVAKVLDTCRDKSGKLWALPLNSDVGMIYLRTDFPEVVVPESWDDYFGPAAKTTLAAAKASHPEIEAANAAQLSVDDEMLTISALEAMWAAGGTMVAPNGQVSRTATEPEEVAFGEADRMGIKNLAAASRDLDIVLPGDEAKKTTAEMAAQAFEAGRTVFMRNWAVARENIDGNLPFTAAPQTDGVLGGQNLAISESTDKPRATQELIKFLTNASSQQILSEVGGFVPTRTSAFTYAKRPGAEHILAALNSARLRPITPCYVEFSQVFRDGIGWALNSGGEFQEGFPRELAEVLNC